jgi:hypothetical protein
MALSGGQIGRGVDVDQDAGIIRLDPTEPIAEGVQHVTRPPVAGDTP